MQKFRTLLVREQLSKDFDRLFRQETDPDGIYKLMQMLHADAQLEEHMWVVHLNSSQKITGVTEASIGGLCQTAANPSEVFRTAILSGAAAIVVVHNHPSGDTTPSPEDFTATRKLVEAGRIIGIPVVDHLVIGDEGFTALSSANPAVFLF